MRQHAYLAAMMCFVGDHVGNRGSAHGPRPSPTIAAKLPDTTFRAGEGFGQHLQAALRALCQRNADLVLRAVGAIELRR